MSNQSSGRGSNFFVIAVPYIWFLFVFLIPLLIIFRLSFVEELPLINPMGEIFSLDGLSSMWSLDRYSYIFSSDHYFLTYLRSISYAFFATIICLAIGYPFAYFMARAPSSTRLTLVMLVMMPFWTSFLIRVYAWKGILQNNGILNNFLLWIGVIDQPITFMNTQFSLMIGMVYTYLPFMILPLYATLSKMDVRLIEAATDLGSTPLSTFFRVTVPLSKAGIVAGSLLVFIPCIGEYVIPELLGGPATQMIGRVLWDEFFSNNDWPMASALTVLIISLILIPMTLLNRAQNK